VRELDKRKRALTRWIATAGRAADVSASRRTAIAAGFERLPTFLDELRGTMARLEDLTDAQTPLLNNLRVAAPSLNTFLQRLGPFSQASLPAIRSLGDTATVGQKALRDSSEDIRVLNQLAKNAPSAGKPLRQLLQTLDDRSRALRPDPRAAETAPPAPDPTSNAQGHGFTGFEAILNYVYWQTLSLNQFDSVSHMLRGVAIQDPLCSPYQNDLRSNSHEIEVRNRCNSYTGPNQPGITTSDMGSVSRARTPAKRRGERRGPNQPEAGPLPGQVDYSKPHPGLSTSQRELLDGLRSNSPRAPQAPPGSSSGSGGSVGQVLDYLLAP
jgi:hypothetical protein